MTILNLFSLFCLAVFVLAVAIRAARIARLPPHLRWELYPVAHEKGRAAHGGSYMERPEWWTRKRETSFLGTLRFMLPEILLLAGVRRSNPRHWRRSYPFHLGLYLVAATTILLAAGGLAEALGARVPAGGVLGIATCAAGYAGFVLGLAGALALLARRLLDAEYRAYTAPLDLANLGAFAAAFGLGLVAQVSSDPGFSLMRGFFAGFFGRGVGLPALLSAEAVLFSLLAAYVPLTHMSHFFTKWFLYHGVRFDDAPLERGSPLERRLSTMLASRPTWSAPHIAGDGTRTWADIAAGDGRTEERR